MNNWEQDLKIYRLEQAPPKYENYQEYFDRYFKEDDDTYLAWFLHYYEKELNAKARGFVNEYAMNTVHAYIRSMRTGYTSQSIYADAQLRTVMWKFAELGYRYDEEAVNTISKETGISPKNVNEILLGGYINMNRADFYCQYGDEDREDSLEEVVADRISQTEELYFRIERAEKVMSTYESLNYRERAIVADHLGFCRDCYATYYYDKDDLDEDGNPKRKPRRKVPFIELAVEHGLASSDTADKTYRSAIEKMRIKLNL